MLRPLSIAALLLTLGASPIHATPLAECVDLSPDHQGARFGSQYLVIKDGERHYRLGFSGSCGALASPGITISTAGEKNRLCATNTIVSSRRDQCQVVAVEQIDARDYARYAKTARGR